MTQSSGTKPPELPRTLLPLNPPMTVDTWVWGTERVLWGFSPEHQYTFKVLEPKVGRVGCLSLQYHHEKSESWFVLRGELWGLFFVNGQICTRIMRPRDVQHLPTGMVHRICAITPDAQVLEPSTPDRHASDKSVPKDVVRLHCFQGRPCTPARTPEEAALVGQSVTIAEEAFAAIEAGTAPKELNRELLAQFGAFSVS